MREKETPILNLQMQLKKPKSMRYSTVYWGRFALSSLQKDENPFFAKKLNNLKFGFLIVSEDVNVLFKQLILMFFFEFE